ncbi:hypothetical protein [Actinorugispora endophytica]|uniref:Glycosyl hydrolase family 18 (Putative chitinase) n=1 Tax=Actinorugispora endophytica TaxID=1605990 RepID=A0A4V3D8K0_9ACTN|nr:hypothetical protein [Actinorugispora endophytica]TDQ52074.1 hypothetical protein EV190_10855 [Actinorugispora endophytica]
MRWLLKRVLAGLAAVLVVATGAGALLAMQFSGERAAWAASSGDDAAWLGNAWVSGDGEGNGEAEFARALPRLGVFSEVYVHVGEIGTDGSVDPAGYAGAEAFLGRMERELPDVRVLGWLSSTADGSSLIEDRFDDEARARLAEGAGAVVDAGFDGVHYGITPVSVNDPSFPDLLELTREAIGEEAVLSVEALQIELIPGLRLPVFFAARGERYWSSGYLRQVAELADGIVIRGHGTGMPGGSLYGGFMVRQTELALDAVPEDVTLRIGAPSFQHESWGPVSGSESVAGAAEAVRIGLTAHGERDGFGMALYVLDDTGEEDWAAFEEGWLDPAR